MQVKRVEMITQIHDETHTTLVIKRTIQVIDETSFVQKFQHWQDEEWEIILKNIYAYNAETNEYYHIKSSTLEHSNKSLIIDCSFQEATLSEKMITIVVEIDTTNYFPHLYNKKYEWYEEFSITFPIEKFIYTLVSPNTLGTFSLNSTTTNIIKTEEDNNMTISHLEVNNLKTDNKLSISIKKED